MVVIHHLDSSSAVPLYRQLSDQIRDMIAAGQLRPGCRLPATRELAGQLGLNRTTISAAYEVLEAEGLITGHVGRGSFVATRQSDPERQEPISFSSSRPSELLFPMDDFRAACTEVIRSVDAQEILQLGSPAGYAPLRRFLLQQAREEGAAGENDDILITTGCQQAFDLLQRTTVGHGETILLEDPVYPGLKNAFQRAGARVSGVTYGPTGLDLERLEKAVTAERPTLLVVTSNFQNPTGYTLSIKEREELLRLIQRTGTLLVENDIYGELRYTGETIPPIKKLAAAYTGASERTILLRSFSKLAFPGLRVGWAIGPRWMIEQLTEAKQWSDLHSDQLSQAVLLRFAESGRLAQHRERVLTSGRERLQAALSACERHLPAGSEWTRPEGGMSLWVRLPRPLDADDLLPRAERAGVTYLPGKHFAVGATDPGTLRISFCGVDPESIETGLAALGRVFQDGLVRSRERLESSAMV